MQSALINTSFPKFTGLTIGRVYKVYPSANMVDIMMFDGSLLPKVQIMVSSVSTTSGKVEIPIPKYKDGVMTDKTQRPSPLQAARDGESDVIAIVAFLGGSVSRPIVLGFLFPEENEILCNRTQKGNEDGSMLLWKHFSNVYVRVAKGSTSDKPAEIEISHPSGLLIKIGDYDGSKDPDEQRTPIENYDKAIRPFKWKNPENDELGPVPYAHVYHPSGTYFTIDPSGNVTAYTVGNLNSTVKGDVTELVEGSVDRTINVDLTETIKGDVLRVVDGDEDNTVKGLWDRKSDNKIEDTAPAVHHNES